MSKDCCAPIAHNESLGIVGGHAPERIDVLL